MQETVPAGLCHFSIITCVYRSYPYLKRFIELSLQALREIECTSFELVFVIDGSPDSSLELLIEEKKLVPQIVVIEFSRNFGHHYAAHAGLQYARGEWVFLIDCDLEVSPLIIVDFYRRAREESCDVVYAYQVTRKGGWLERWGGGVFWRLFNALSDTRVPANVLTERLLSRRYVDALLTLGDRNLFLAGMMHWVGFKQIGQPVEKIQREGRSTYTLRRRVALLIEAVTSFSAVPLRLLFSTGLVITFGSLLFSLYLIIKKLLHPEMILIGFTSVSVLILLSLGVIMASIGVVGIYLSKIYRQIQNRPLFIVKNVYL
jgi:putative glycosyltransferase